MSTFIDCTDNLACATLSGSNGVGIGLVAGTPNKIVVSGTGNYTGNFNITGSAIITDNSSNAALRITQTGAGEAIRVEDSTNPDSTPFVVNSVGSVGIGTSNPGAELDVVGDGFINLDLRSAGAAGGTAGSYITLRRSGGTTASRTILTNGDYVGGYLFSGYDGSTYRTLGAIYGIVNGVPGSNDMPGAIAFSTTADGAGTETERMRITSDGNVGIGTSSPSDKLDINGSIIVRGTRIYHSASNYLTEFGPGAGTGDVDYHGYFVPNNKAIALYANGGNSTLVLSGSNVGIGTTSPAVKLHVASNTTTWIRSQAGSSSAGGNGIPIFNCNKSRGTVTSPTAVTNGDELGRFDVRGYNFNDFRQAAQISAVCTATPGGSDTAIASALYFKTSPGGTTAPADRMIINSAGNVGIDIASPTSKLHVNGDIAADSIIFGSVSGVVTSKTLDDYEVGTWTPRFSGSVNTSFASTQNGQYIKIGRMVYVDGTITLTSTGSSSGNLTIGNLPFAVNASQKSAGFTSRCTGLVGTFSGSFAGEVFNSTTRIDLYKATNTGHGFAYVFDLTNVSTITFSAYYIT